MATLVREEESSDEEEDDINPYVTEIEKVQEKEESKVEEKTEIKNKFKIELKEDKIVKESPGVNNLLKTEKVEIKTKIEVKVKAEEKKTEPVEPQPSEATKEEKVVEEKIEYFYPKNTKSKDTLLVKEEDSFSVIEKDVTEYSIKNLLPNAPEFEKVEDNSCSTPITEKMRSYILFKDDPNLKLLRKHAAVKYLNTFLLSESEILKKFNSKLFDVENYFYWMVQNYHYTCLRLASQLKDLDNSKKELQQMESQLNTFQTLKKPGTGYCTDGKSVSGEVTSMVARFNYSNFDLFKVKLDIIKDMYYRKISTTQFERKLWKQKIEFHLDSIYTNKEFRNITEESQVNVEIFDRETSLEKLVEEMRSNCQVLFHFNEMEEKNKSIPEFFDEVKKWIRQLVAYLLRISNVDDHRFLIYTLIKCRNIGEWGSDLLQIPDIEDDNGVDFFIAILSIFLKKEDSFVLTENDYISLSEQFPFYQVVNYLFVKSKSGKRFSKFQDMKMSFNGIETILYILDRSISVFNVPRYRRFARQLAHTILRYCKITLSTLTENNLLSDDKIRTMCSKFFVKCFNSIFSSEHSDLRLWYFLIQFPFSSIDQETSLILFTACFNIKKEEYKNLLSFEGWRLFFKNNKKYRTDFSNLLTKNETSSPFLIDAFTKMACSDKSNIVLPAVISLELFYFLLLSLESTPTVSSLFLLTCKSIGRICEDYPKLISMIFRLISENFNTLLNFSVTILKELPLLEWVPEDEDLDALKYLLCSKPEPNSAEIKTAKFVVSRLDIGKLTGIHQKKICFMVARSLHSMKTKKTGLFRGKDEKLEFKDFFWNILLRIRVIDWNGNPILNPYKINDPDLNLYVTNIELSTSPKKEFDCISGYILLKFSNYGYIVDTFNEKAMKWLEFMAFWKKHDVLIRVMNNLVLIMIDNCDELNFSDIIINIFYASETFSETLGHYILSSIGIKTKQFSQTIGIFISNIHKENVGKAKKFAKYWLSQLFKIRNWNQNISVLYCINEICRVCLLLRIHEDIMGVICEREGFKNYSLGKKRKILSFLKNKLMTKFPGEFFPFKSKNVVPEKRFPFLSLILFINKVEKNKKARGEFGMKLMGNFNDRKKLINSKGHEYVIYIILAHCFCYTQFLIKNENEENEIFKDVHSFLILNWQLFFRLYFEFTINQGNKMYYGYIFLELSTRDKLKKEIVKNLSELFKIYDRKITKLENERNSSAKATSKGNLRLYKNLRTVYLSMKKWIQTPFVQILDQFLKGTLGDDYSIIELCNLINLEKTSFWSHLIDYGTLYENFTNENAKILGKIFPNLLISMKRKKKIFVNRVNSSIVLNLKVIEENEKKYIKPLPPLHRNFSENIEITAISSLEDIKVSNLDEFNSSLKNFIKIEEDYNKALCSYYPTLYNNVVVEKKIEVGCYRGPFCRGKADIRVRIEEFQKKIEIENNIKNVKVYSEQLKSNFEKSIIENNKIYLYVMKIEKSINEFIKNKNEKEGVRWFYLLEVLNISTPFLEKIISKYIENLSANFIKNNSKETFVLFTYILEKEERIERLLHKVFFPVFDDWIKYMELINVKHQSIKNEKNLRLLLNKFDIDFYLQNYQSNFKGIKQIFLVSFFFYTTENQPVYNKNRIMIEFWERNFFQILNFKFFGLYIVSLESVFKGLNQIPFEFLSKYVQNFNVDMIRKKNFLNDKNLFENQINIINTSLWKFRKDNSYAFLYILIQNRNGGVSIFNDFFKKIFFSINIDKNRNNEENFDFLFELLCKCYEPFIFTLSFQQENGQMLVANPIKETEIEMVKQFTLFFNGFLEIINYFLTVKNFGLLNQLWHLYFKILHFSTSERLLKRINVLFLEKIDWKYFHKNLNENIIYDFHEIVENYHKKSLKNPLDTVNLIRKIFGKIQWGVLEPGKFSSQFFESVFIIFFNFFTIYHHTKAKTSVLIDNQSVFVNMKNWNVMKVVELKSIVSWIVANSKNFSSPDVVVILLKIFDKIIVGDFTKFFLIFQSFVTVIVRGMGSGGIWWEGREKILMWFLGSIFGVKSFQIEKIYNENFWRLFGIGQGGKYLEDFIEKHNDVQLLLLLFRTILKYDVKNYSLIERIQSKILIFENNWANVDSIFRANFKCNPSKLEETVQKVEILGNPLVLTAIFHNFSSVLSKSKQKSIFLDVLINSFNIVKRSIGLSQNLLPLIVLFLRRGKVEKNFLQFLVSLTSSSSSFFVTKKIFKFVDKVLRGKKDERIEYFLKCVTCYLICKYSEEIEEDVRVQYVNIMKKILKKKNLKITARDSIEKTMSFVENDIKKSSDIEFCRIINNILFEGKCKWIIIGDYSSNDNSSDFGEVTLDEVKEKEKEKEENQLDKGDEIGQFFVI